MAFTRILGPGIHTASNINSHNIKSTGIITAVSFVGDGSGLTGVASTDNIVTGTAATFNTYPVDINAGMTVAGVSTMAAITATTGTFSGAVSGTTANFSGNVTVGGVLTYEDVKNVDSVGLGTFREGIFIPDNKKLELGNAAGSGDLQLYHDTSNSYIKDSGTGNLLIQGNNIVLENTAGDNYIFADNGGAVILYHNGNNKFYTTSTGAHVNGTLSGASQIGIQSAGTQIGAGITQLNFVGTGNTFAVNGTTVDISIAGGGGAGAGGTWSTYTAGIATTKSVGVNTSNLDDTDLTGIGNSFKGLYISNGMIVHDNVLNGNHYIGTSMNGLMAGPVTIDGNLEIDGNYVVV